MGLNNLLEEEPFCFSNQAEGFLPCGLLLSRVEILPVMIRSHRYLGKAAAQWYN